MEQIFPKHGMKLGNNKGKKIAGSFFGEKFLFSQALSLNAKNSDFPQKSQILAKNASFRHSQPNFSKFRIFLKREVLLYFHPYCPLVSCQVWWKSIATNSFKSNISRNIATMKTQIFHLSTFFINARKISRTIFFTHPIFVRTQINSI